MKEISGARLYKNIQYFWVYRKGRSLDALKAYLGPDYVSYQLLPKIERVPNRTVRRYAKLLKTSVSRLRMKDGNRDGKINNISKIRTKKYNLKEARELDEKATTFIAPLGNSRRNNTPKPNVTSKKWNDYDAKRLREYLENKRNGVIDDSDLDRGAIK